MKTTVEITWDRPEDQNWLCAGNILLALQRYCKNTRFEVKEVSKFDAKLDELHGIAKYVEARIQELFVLDKMTKNNSSEEYDDLPF